MTAHGRQTAPVPVVVAAVVLLVVAAIPARHLLTSGSSMATGLLAALLFLALAHGLWRGSGRARFGRRSSRPPLFCNGVVIFAGGDVSGPTRGRV